MYSSSISPSDSAQTAGTWEETEREGDDDDGVVLILQCLCDS